MVRLIGIINPFDAQQNMFVYEDSNKIDAETFEIDKINEIIFKLTKKYDTKEVSLAGSKQYLRGLIKRFKEAEFTKYNENTIQIDIL
jgi:hypothetical protein